MKRLLAAAVAALSSAALVAAAHAAGPKLPAKAAYAGQNSHGKAARITVSKQGKRVGYTMYVKLPCANGESVDGVYWTTEGKFYGQYWIRPTAKGAFKLNSANDGTWDGGTYKASARFAGRFTSATAATGTFRGHIAYYNADGSLLTKCDTGPVTWSVKRR